MMKLVFLLFYFVQINFHTLLHVYIFHVRMKFAPPRNAETYFLLGFVCLKFYKHAVIKTFLFRIKHRAFHCYDAENKAQSCLVRSETILWLL
jgi:hypothetical protein